MAADISKDALSVNSLTDLGTLNSASAKDTIQFDGENEKMVLLVLNGDAADAYINVQAGDYWKSSQGANLFGGISQDDYAAIVLETARFKDTNEEITVEVLDSDGSVFSGTASNISYALLELP